MVRVSPVSGRRSLPVACFFNTTHAAHDERRFAPTCVSSMNHVVVDREEHQGTICNNAAGQRTVERSPTRARGQRRSQAFDELVLHGVKEGHTIIGFCPRGQIRCKQQQNKQFAAHSRYIVAVCESQTTVVMYVKSIELVLLL